MMKMKMLAAAATAALFSMSGAIADNPRSLGSISAAGFEDFDRNNDGLITRGEWNGLFRPGASASTQQDRSSDRPGARGGYPTAPTGEPWVGGPAAGQDWSARGREPANATAGATRDQDAAREGARRGYPTAPTGGPRVGGPRVEQAEARSQPQREPSASAGATGELPPWQRGYPTSPIGEPQVGGPRVMERPEPGNPPGGR